MRVDAHQHFWQFQPARDRWITPEMPDLRRDFLPEDLAPCLRAHQLDACVAVQADQSEAETRFLLTLARKHAFIKAVVGWIDLQAPTLPAQLETYQDEKILKGFRHIVQAEPAGYLHRPEILRGVATLGRAGYTYDLLVYPAQLPEAIAFAAQLPSQRLVIDHIGKPGIRQHLFREWASAIRQLAQHQHVYCKISGLVTEADWRDWKSTDFTPYLEHVVDCFGVHRVMYGSDWPVCLLAATYETQFNLVDRFFESFADSDKRLIFGENAERFYNLKP